MSGSWERKFTYLSDPPVATAPFTIDLDEDKCIGCGLCLKQCPCQTLALVEREPSPSQQPACQFACPCGTDIRGYIKALNQGASFETVWRMITRTNPMPAITGRVCPHMCESACNRSGVDSPVNINKMESSIGDYAIEHNLAFEKPTAASGKKVAVVGAGPSGMSCAYHLARLGYKVTVFDENELPGGMLRSVLPRFRLPVAVIDKELTRIIDLGLEMRYRTTVGKDVSLEDLKKDFQAVYIAIGAQNGKALGLKGEESQNVYDGLTFLRLVAAKKVPKLGKRVVVIGGGNTAIDAARIARRMGSEVTILYRRGLQEMPAAAHEVELATQEGVRIELLCAPLAFSLNGGKSVKTVRCGRMQLGEKDASGRPKPSMIPGSEFEVQADAVIAAIGQELVLTGFDNLATGGLIGADTNGLTSQKGVFCGGDAAAGPATVALAIGAGLRAALAMDAYLQGRELPSNHAKKEISFADIPLSDHEKIKRNEAVWLDPQQRIADLEREECASIKPEQVQDEARRCLGCGTFKSDFVGLPYFGKICIACHNCEAICPHDALKFPKFYQVNQGRWTTDFSIPEDSQGRPNPFQEQEAPSYENLAPRLTAVEDVIYRRRSNRVFKPDQIPAEMIHRMLEAGRFAPSAGNSQPWQFVVVRDRALLDELSAACTKTLTMVTKIYQGKDPVRQMLKNSLAFLKPDSIDQRPMAAIQALTLPKFGQKDLDVFFHAPTVIYVLVNKMGISKPIFSTGMCCQNIVLAAHAMGLGTCYSGFGAEPINLNPKLKAKLGITWPYDNVATTICVGFPAIPIDRPVCREYPKVKWIE